MRWRLGDHLADALRTWNEEDHPRDDQGQFSESGGGDGGGASEGGGDAAASPVSSSQDYTKEEREQVREYQNGAAINGYLRDANNPKAPAFVQAIARQKLETPQMKRQLAALDSAIGKGSLTESVTLYRGINLVLIDLPDVGKTFKDPAFAATSTSEKIAGGFGTIFEIHAPKGTSALDVSAMLGSETRYDQKEIMLPRDLTYRVESRSDDRVILKIVKED